MAHHHHRHTSRHRHHTRHHHTGPHLVAHEQGNATEIAGYLTSLADAIRSGGVQLRAGDRAVGMRLARALALDLYAEVNGHGANLLALTLTWRAPSDEDQPHARPLHITSLPPPHAAAQRADRADQPQPEDDPSQYGAGFGD